MKQEIREKWVEALRSGDYQQTREQLKNDSSFCCLGVLCDLSELGYWKGNGYQIGNSGEPMYKVPPRRVAEWLGFRNDEETIRVWNALSSMNDAGNSFDEIADLIERKYGLQD